MVQLSKVKPGIPNATVIVRVIFAIQKSTSTAPSVPCLVGTVEDQYNYQMRFSCFGSHALKLSELIKTDTYVKMSKFDVIPQRSSFTLLNEEYSLQLRERTEVEVVEKFDFISTVEKTVKTTVEMSCNETCSLRGVITSIVSEEVFDYFSSYIYLGDIPVFLEYWVLI